MTATGFHFVSASVLRLDGVTIPTSFVDGTQLSGTIPAGAGATGGGHTITVFSPAPIGGTTSGQSLTVTNPVPTLGSINPATTLAGSSSFTLTASGTNYNASSAILIDGSPLATVHVSSSVIGATVPAGIMSSTTVHQISAGTPAPGGRTSTSITFTVENPAPLIGARALFL